MVEYRLIRDNSCHWYIVEAKNYDLVLQYFDAVDAYWSSSGYTHKSPPKEPDCEIIEIDGYQSIAFSNYRKI